MKKTILRSLVLRPLAWRRTLAFAGAFGALMSGVSPVSAESMAVHVPFAFNAGSMALPAGDYQVDVSSKVLTIRGVSSGALIAVQADSGTPGIAELVFESGSGTRMLSKISLPSGTAYLAMPIVRAAKATPLSADGVALTRR